MSAAAPASAYTRSAVRIGARDEGTGDDQSLFGKVEMKNPVAGRGVVGFADPVQLREVPTNRGLLVVGIAAGKDEMIVGNGGLPGKDPVAARDLVERMDRKRRGPVRGGE